jgi:hypothetical protein
LSNAGAVEADFAARLLAHAHELCSVFSELTTNDVLQLCGGADGFDHPFLEAMLDRLQAGSSPWTPVPGKTLKTVIAIPHSIGNALRDAILDRLGRPAEYVETNREAIIVIQMTQGYTGEPRRATAAGRL